MLHQRIPVPGRAAAVLDIYVQQNDSELEMVRWKKRPAILILPGGGYNMVADREGEPYALRYMGIGFQAFVLTYTVKADFDTTLADAAAAMKLIRDNAENLARCREHGCEVLLIDGEYQVELPN